MQSSSIDKFQRCCYVQYGDMFIYKNMSCLLNKIFCGLFQNLKLHQTGAELKSEELHQVGGELTIRNKDSFI